jgi:DNA-binding NtrC family response regulator
MTKSIRVLIAEDSEPAAQLLIAELRRGGYDTIHERVDNLEAMRLALDHQIWDIVLADYSMPNFSGTAALMLLKEKGIDLPFILVSGTIGENKAVEVMRAGAHDYVAKDNLKQLVPSIERELLQSEARGERKRGEERLREEITERTRMEGLLKARVRQQAVVATLGQRALSGAELSTLMNETVALVAQTLEVEYSEILELLPDGNGLLMRAGFGWQQGTAGPVVIGRATHTQVYPSL